MLFKNEWSFLNDCDKINNIWDDVRLRVTPTGSVCPICAIFRPAKNGCSKLKHFATATKRLNSETKRMRNRRDAFALLHGSWTH